MKIILKLFYFIYVTFLISCEKDIPIYNNIKSNILYRNDFNDYSPEWFFTTKSNDTNNIASVTLNNGLLHLKTYSENLQEAFAEAKYNFNDSIKFINSDNLYFEICLKYAYFNAPSNPLSLPENKSSSSHIKINFQKFIIDVKKDTFLTFSDDTLIIKLDLKNQKIHALINTDTIYNVLESKLSIVDLYEVNFQTISYFDTYLNQPNNIEIIIDYFEIYTSK